MPEIKMEYSAKYADIDYAGDHEWQPWRKSLHSFAQKIFK